MYVSRTIAYEKSVRPSYGKLAFCWPGSTTCSKLHSPKVDWTNCKADFSCHFYTSFVVLDHSRPIRDEDTGIFCDGDDELAIRGK